jgi:hypothetical protein
LNNCRDLTELEEQRAAEAPEVLDDPVAQVNGEVLLCSTSSNCNIFPTNDVIVSTFASRDPREACFEQIEIASRIISEREGNDIKGDGDWTWGPPKLCGMTPSTKSLSIGACALSIGNDDCSNFVSQTSWKKK